MHTRSLIIAGAVALAALACRDEPTAPAEISRVESASRPVEGWFHLIWVDPAPGYGPATVQYVLVDEKGHGTELDLSPGVADRWGGPRGLNGRKVRVDGNPVVGGRLRVRSIEPVAGPVRAEASAVQVGPRPYVTILCKFPDVATVHLPRATYVQWTTGTTYPSLDHYWRQVSYNQMNVTGSKVVGWYTLPHPMSYYAAPATPDDPGYFNSGDLLSDCVAAADAHVYFPQFYGINLQFNGEIGGRSMATIGNTWTVTLDGQTKAYGVAWLTGRAAISSIWPDPGSTRGHCRARRCAPKSRSGQARFSRFETSHRYL